MPRGYRGYGGGPPGGRPPGGEPPYDPEDPHDGNGGRRPYRGDPPGGGPPGGGPPGGGPPGPPGPPDDPPDEYDDRESINSDDFPSYDEWPHYGKYYRTKPPHPKSRLNPADYYGIPYYHYQAGWPRAQEYHYTRTIPGGEDKWVWQERNGPSQQELNREAKLNLKLPSSFNGNDRRKWRSFLAECAVHFQAKQATYKDGTSKVAFAASLLEGPALTHYTTCLQQNHNDIFFRDWSVFVERMTAMFGMDNQRGQAQRRIQHMRMREDERFAQFLTKFQEDAFDCGYNEVALKAALRQCIADRLLSRLQYHNEPAAYSLFVSLLLRLDARYWEVRDTLDARNRSSGYSRWNQYGSSSYGGSYNTSYRPWNNRRRSPSTRKKPYKKEKAKRMHDEEWEENQSEGYEGEDEDDEDNPYQFYTAEEGDLEAPQPIENASEAKEQFRRLYTSSSPDIKEALKRISPQEKEERMQKGLCLYCGKPGHRIATCNLLADKEKGRSIKVDDDEAELWDYDEEPLKVDKIRQ